MTKKFVSLFFAPDNIQFLILNQQNRSIEKFGTIPIPRGIIVNSKVVDQAQIVQILRDSWEKFGIIEKTVSIIIPEFSTFIKSLRLPKLSFEELDEAVRWQAQELLFYSGSETILDWKIIETGPDYYQILVVAVLKEVLSSYVDSISNAGLYPIAVETPSLSLARITQSETSGKLLIYLIFQEALLAVAKGNEIFGSSITPAIEDRIVFTAEQIIQHYNEIKIEKIIIGGIGITKNLYQNIQDKFNIKPSWMQINIKGLTPAQIQEYLLPLSMQLSNPQSPRDENSINLLPLRWVKQYESKKAKFQVNLLITVFTLFVLINFLLAFFQYYNFLSQLKALKATSPTQSQEFPKDLASQAEKINSVSEEIVKVNTNSISFRQLADSIISSRPLGIEIVEYKIDFLDGRIQLKGKAIDRESLITFKQNLQNNKNFSDVQVPLSNLELQQNFDFELSANFGETKEKGGKLPLLLPPKQ